MWRFMPPFSEPTHELSRHVLRHCLVIFFGCGDCDCFVARTGLSLHVYLHCHFLHCPSDNFAPSGAGSGSIQRFSIPLFFCALGCCSSYGIAAQCTWRCMSGCLVVWAGRLFARASNCWLSIHFRCEPESELRLGANHWVPVLHTHGSGILKVMMSLLRAVILSERRANPVAASVSHAYLIGCHGPWTAAVLSDAERDVGRGSFFPP